MIALKAKLYQQCMEYAEKRIQTIQNVIAEAQKSANSETKSSMGDKYETTRSMLQLDTEMNTKQLVEAMRLKTDLQKMETHLTEPHESVQIGSLIFTNQANYFIAIGAGKLTVEEMDFFVISPTAPLCKQLWGLKAGDNFLFNKQQFTIKEVK